MWANYDYTQFPIVKVTFNEKIESEEDFNDYLIIFETLSFVSG